MRLAPLTPRLPLSLLQGTTASLSPAELFRIERDSAQLLGTLDRVHQGQSTSGLEALWTRKASPSLYYDLAFADQKPARLPNTPSPHQSWQARLRSAYKILDRLVLGINLAHGHGLHGKRVEQLGLGTLIKGEATEFGVAWRRSYETSTDAAGPAPGTSFGGAELETQWNVVTRWEVRSHYWFGATYWSGPRINPWLWTGSKGPPAGTKAFGLNLGYVSDAFGVLVESLRCQSSIGGDRIWYQTAVGLNLPLSSAMAASLAFASATDSSLRHSAAGLSYSL